MSALLGFIQCVSSADFQDDYSLRVSSNNANTLILPIMLINKPC